MLHIDIDVSIVYAVLVIGSLFSKLYLRNWTCPSTIRRGQVVLGTVNDQAMVPFVSQQLNNLELALAMAKRAGLPGAEALIAQQFERMWAAGQYKEAAEAAADSPQVDSRHKSG
jgi:hypothetical protein